MTLFTLQNVLSHGSTVTDPYVKLWAARKGTTPEELRRLERRRATGLTGMCISAVAFWVGLMVLVIKNGLAHWSEFVWIIFSFLLTMCVSFFVQAFFTWQRSSKAFDFLRSFDQLDRKYNITTLKLKPKITNLMIETVLRDSANLACQKEDMAAGPVEVTPVGPVDGVAVSAVKKDLDLRTVALYLKPTHIAQFDADYELGNEFFMLHIKNSYYPRQVPSV